MLSVEALTVRLPRLGDRTYAVRDLSFTLDKGEILCIVGESGSGKSICANAIMGLLPGTETGADLEYLRQAIEHEIKHSANDRYPGA